MLQKAFELNGDRVVFANTQSGADARAVLREILSVFVLYIKIYAKRASELASENMGLLSGSNAREEARQILIGGMPNVGKSSLLNALRRAGVNKG